MAVERTFKRSVSPSYMAEPVKKSKFVGNVLARFGMRGTDDSNVNNLTETSVVMDEPTSMANFNRFRSENLGNRNVSDITALRLYHESLKKQNNDRYSELLGETSRYDPQSDTGSIQEDQTFNNDSNNTVIQHQTRGQKRPFKESRESSFIIPATQRIPTLRQQLSKINPRERSNLINLKRKMKLDAYYRRKMNYLNYYNKHNVNSNDASINNSLMSINSSFQPQSKDTTLRSTKKLLKAETHVNKKAKTQEITNTSGVFNGSFMYDLDEDDDQEDEKDNTIGYKPINIGINKLDNNKYAPKTLTPGMENIIGGQRKLLSTNRVSSLAKESTLGLPKENTLLESQKLPIIGPSSSFKFINDDKNSENVQDNESLINGSKNGTSEDKKSTATISPVFALGSSEKDNAENTQKSQNILGFNFNKKDEPPKASFLFASGNNNLRDSEKPLFSFSLSGSNGQTPSFGTSVEKKSETKDPTLSFGGNVKKDDVAGPSFNFELKEKKEELTKPTFSFGNAEKKNDDAATKPAFSFGNTEKKDEASKPAFSFGNTEKKDEATKPAFSFGDKNDVPVKPAFSFGNTEKKDEASKPAFSFGNAEKKDDVIKPTFAFGTTEKKDEAPAAAFSFGATENKDVSTKPSFSFGGAEKINGSEPLTKAPAFQFGQSATAVQPPSDSSDSKPSFNFGSSVPSKPLFSFASNQQQATPVNDDKEEAKEENERKRRFAGSKSENNNGSGNKFSFGSSTILTGDSKPAIASPNPMPSFGFANGGVKPAGFSFGNTNGHSSTPSASSEKGISSSLPKPAFNFNTGNTFGNAVQNSSKESTPAAGNDNTKFEFGGTAKPMFGATGTTTPFASSGKTTPVGIAQQFQQQQLPLSSFQFNPGSAKLDPASVFGANAQQHGFNFENTSNASSTFNPSRSVTPASFNFNGSAGAVNPTAVFGAHQQQDPSSSTPGFGNIAQPGNMFGVANGGALGNMFGGFNQQQQQQQPGGLFGGQQLMPASGQPNVFGNTGVTPLPAGGTPLPRRLARMRQPRSHR